MTKTEAARRLDEIAAEYERSLPPALLDLMDVVTHMHDPDFVPPSAEKRAEMEQYHQALCSRLNRGCGN